MLTVKYIKPQYQAFRLDQRTLTEKVRQLLESAGINETQAFIAVNTNAAHINIEKRAKEITLISDKLFCMEITVINNLYNKIVIKFDQ